MKEKSFRAQAKRSGKRRRRSRLCVGLLLVLLCASSCAETVTGDLQARYSHVPKLEYAGETWTQKSRVTALLVLGTAKDGQAEQPFRTEFAAIIAVDDNAKRVTLMELDPAIVPELGESKTALRDIPGVQALEQLDAAELTALGHALLPYELIEHYFVINLDDLAIYGMPGDAAQDETYNDRLKSFKRYAEGLSASEQTELLSELSASFYSDLKSGAMMKLADKAERYEILPTIHVPTQSRAANGEEAQLYLNEAELLPIIAETFFELRR